MVDIPNLNFLTEDAVGALINAIAGPQWGIFLSTSSFASAIGGFLGTLGVPASIATAVAGAGLPTIPVLAFDSFVSFEIKQDFAISDYPVENGGFQSYDKVQLPSDIRVRLSAGGSVTNRQELLATIDAQIGTTLLYDIVTPEKVFINYCFSHRDWRRSAKDGLGLLVIDLWFTEIRISAAATFTNTAQPGIAGLQGIGNVQAATPSAAAQTQVQGALGN